jgi:hypothetical protein
MSEEVKKQSKPDKKPANPYLLFGQSIRASLKDKYPGLPNKELLKKIAEEWKALPEAEKKKFQDKSEELKVEYRKSHPQDKEKKVRKVKKSEELREPIKKKVVPMSKH